MTNTARRGLWVLGACGALAWLVPLLSRDDPTAITDVLARRLVAPLHTDLNGVWHPLGTDRFGRDLLVRLFLAARISLLVGIVGSVAASAIGVAVGSVAGWRSGTWIDRVFMSMADALLSIPRLVLLLLAAALFQPGVTTVVVVLVATGWMSVARLVRGEVMRLANASFVESARSLGVAPHWLLMRHVVPNALGPAVVATTLGVGSAILLESGLAFLGLGVQPPAASWGNMIAGGRELITTAPWVALAPGLALIGTVMLCTAIGEGLHAQHREGAHPLRDRA